jgi:hypothetical protein
MGLTRISVSNAEGPHARTASSLHYSGHAQSQNDDAAELSNYTAQQSAFASETFLPRLEGTCRMSKDRTYPFPERASFVNSFATVSFKEEA